MRISDWSSDVCSSDLQIILRDAPRERTDIDLDRQLLAVTQQLERCHLAWIGDSDHLRQCRGTRQYVTVVAEADVALPHTGFGRWTLGDHARAQRPPRLCTCLLLPHCHRDSLYT